MIRIIFISFFTSILFVSCSNVNTVKEYNTNDEIASPDEIYKIAKDNFDKSNYDIANEEFIKLTNLYPLSNEAIQAEIMIGFISYLKMDYERSIYQFEKIMNKYPSHKNIDYVYYMKAMCNYEQITHHSLDGKYNELALENFNQVLSRFPNSEYAKDSRQKIILVKSNKAAKHMEIGRFYLNQKKYTAALNRFKIVVEDYSMTKFTPEALHRMVEAYYEMGMEEESIKSASILGHNYPNSKWYSYSYNLIKKINNEDSYLQKLKNIF
ncbi:MAG: hypothetical protein CBD97_03635 [Pelagibacteraceae bacterium TMED237]|nr:MAG: hypothetical protein CBD97_03635 [Pelagibacteraceae bacterium TMED237]|tara:strand:+ start:975 stop:1775 length:801 start_codon:yes stop_codon:yes gene_type:complete